MLNSRTKFRMMVQVEGRRLLQPSPKPRYDERASENKSPAPNSSTDRPEQCIKRSGWSRHILDHRAPLLALSRLNQCSAHGSCQRIKTMEVAERSMTTHIMGPTQSPVSPRHFSHQLPANMRTKVECDRMVQQRQTEGPNLLRRPHRMAHKHAEMPTSGTYARRESSDHQRCKVAKLAAMCEVSVVSWSKTKRDRPTYRSCTGAVRTATCAPDSGGKLHQLFGTKFANLLQFRRSEWQLAYSTCMDLPCIKCNAARKFAEIPRQLDIHAVPTVA